MLKKIIVGFLILATTTLFGMSLSQLNGANKAELMEINGIGEVKAAAILKERKHGKFKSFDDFMQRVEGVGEQVAANVKGGVKNSADVKKVAKSTKKRATKSKKEAKETVSKKRKSAKKEVEEKAKKSTKKAKSEAKETKKRKIKSMDDKKKELKSKAKKTKEKKTRAKKTKKTKSKKKN
jgi:competence protein ComEA